ncbi:MAG: FAD-dependent oxidoreductase, partial [Clostridiales bacterium]|nr:FAD-dependent oxidoreductase [Clostridiales bacterium]
HASGLDGVYLHGHEGYLLEQVTNPAFNRRKFGKYSDWQRFGIDMVKEIRRRTNGAYPIMYRIDLSLALNETYGEDGMKCKSLKKFKNGRTVEMTLDYMKNLVAAGVDMFDVDLGCYDNWWLPHPPGAMPPGCFIDIARLVKSFFKENKILSNAGVEVPVVAVGKLGYPDLAEKALREEKCDMVMLGRPLLADPYWPQKAYAGKVSDIRPCIGCQEGCINEFVEGGHPQCAVNPRTAFEHLMPADPPKAEIKKRVAVIGAGPAGVVTAVTLARRGHEVDLIEKSGKIGGKIIPGSVPKIKFDLDNYRIYLEKLVKDTSANYSLNLITGITADAKWLKEQSYDTAVFAVGSSQSILKLPGYETANIVQATDLLVKPELLGDAKKAVVIGGCVVGCETAYWLKYEKGVDVKVVEMTEYIMNHVCTANRGHLIHNLQKAEVELLNCTKLAAYEKDGVKVIRNVSKSVPNPYITWHPILPENVENPLAPKLKIEEREEKIPADIVVVAAGGRPGDELFLDCQKQHAADELYNIGDSFAVGKVLEAVRAAYALATSI